MSASDTPSSPPSRRRREWLWTRRIVLSVVLLCAAAVVGAAVAWVTLGDRIARHAADYLNRSVFEEGATRLVLGHIGGYPINGVNVRDVRLEVRDAEDWYAFVAADELVVRYDIWALLNGRYGAKKVTAHGLRFELRERPEAGYGVPSTRAAGGGGGSGPFTFGIDALEIVDGSLRIDLPGFALTLDDVEADLDIAARGSRIDIGIESLTAAVGDTLGRLRVERGKIVVGEGVRLEDLALEWDGARLVLDGQPVPADTAAAGELRLAARGLELGKIGRLLGYGDVLDPGYVDTLETTLTFAETGLVFEAAGNARWSRWSVRDAHVSGIVESDRIVLEDVHLAALGATVDRGRLVLPLDGPGLELSGRVSGLRTDSLAVFPGIEGMDGTVAGTVDIRFEDRSAPESGFALTARLGPSHVYQVPMEAAYARIRRADGAYLVDSLRVDLARAVIRARGRAGADAVDLRFAYDGDLRPLRRVVRVEDLSGRGGFRGRLLGPPSELRLEAVGEAVDLHALTLDAPRVGLTRAAGPLTGRRQLELTFAAPEPFRVGGFDVTAAQGEILVYEDRVVMQSFTGARGDTVLTLAGTLNWEPRIRVAAESARLGLGDLEFTLAEAAVITYDGTTFETPGLAVNTPEGRVRASGSFTPSTRRVACSIEMTGFSPRPLLGATGAEEPDALPLDIRVVNGTLDLEGVIPILDGRAEVSVGGIRLDRAHIDSLDTEMTVKGRTVTLEHLWVRRGRGVVEAEGTVRMPAPLYTVLEAEVFGPDLDPDSTLWDVGLRADNMHLTEWLSFIPIRQRPRGTLRGSLYIGGSSAKPELRVDMTGQDLVWRRFHASRILARGRVSEGTAVADTLVLWQLGEGETGVRALSEPLQVSGTVPVNLSIKPFSYGVGEGPVDLLVRSEGASLENLKLTPWVDEAEGTLDGQIRVRGTARHPELSGELRASGDRLRPADRDEILTDLSAVILFERDLVQVVAADAELGGGRVSAQGTYRLYADELATYELRVTADRAVVRETARYAARVSGQLTLRPERGSDGRIYPFATGTLEVDRAEYIGSLRPQDIGEFKPQPILYDIGINAPKRIYVETDDLEAELSADLRVRQEPDQRVINGTMEILTGTYRLFLKRFRITEGELSWNGTSEIPHMDVSAETLEEKYIITVRWSGQYPDHRIEFSARELESGEVAPLTQGEIIRLLGGFSTSEGAVAGAGLITQEIEEQLLREIGFFDDIGIRPEFDESGVDIRVEVRKWLTPDLSVRYEQGLNRYFDQDIALEYRLRRSVILRGESSRERSTVDSSINQEYNLDIKLRHEY